MKSPRVRRRGSLSLGFASRARSPHCHGLCTRGPHTADSALQPLSSLEGRRASGSLSLLPRRCPTQQWPGSLHGRMSLWPGARPQTKALLELGLHPRANRTVPASPCQLGRRLNSPLARSVVATDQEYVSAQEVKRVRALDCLSLALGRKADCSHWGGKGDETPRSQRPEAGRPETKTKP